MNENFEKGFGMDEAAVTFAFCSYGGSDRARSIDYMCVKRFQGAEYDGEVVRGSERSCRETENWLFHIVWKFSRISCKQSMREKGKDTVVKSFYSMFHRSPIAYVCDLQCLDIAFGR